MSHKITYHPKFEKDARKLKLSRKQLISLREKVVSISENPKAKSEGGYGEPLGNGLKGYLKFRFDNDYRVVYKVVESNHEMNVIIIGLRKDKTVYKEAENRVK